MQALLKIYFSVSFFRVYKMAEGQDTGKNYEPGDPEGQNLFIIGLVQAILHL